jgi:hypothetical protein
MMAAKIEPLDPVAGTQAVIAAPSLARSVKLVAWSFLGIRSSQGSRDDQAKISPVHVVVVGLVGALLFVLGLIATVHWVVAK